METILGLIGLTMIYAWIHAVVVIFKKTKKTTTYEQVVLWVALITITLCIIGTL